MQKVRFFNQMQNFHRTKGGDLVELLGVFPGDTFKNIGLVRKKNGKVCLRFLNDYGIAKLGSNPDLDIKKPILEDDLRLSVELVAG
jgi:hypothetical protein